MSKNEAKNEEIPSRHWADQAADELIKKHPEKDVITCAAGISPSGVVHIGNFREVMTVDLVVRALRDRGKKVRFIYSWDECDALRKVPKNLPNQEKIEENLRRPLAVVPDPFGKEASYAAYFEKLFEKEIAVLGIDPEFIYQKTPYFAGDYNEGIRTALKHQKEIVKILDQHRTQPLPDTWTCVSIFCKKCSKDTTKLVEYSPPDDFKYFCRSCKTEESINIEKEGGVKLLWRVDWPMRWAREEVDFEPGGKDHSSTGGSYDTGCEIIRKVWKKEPPHYVQYDFVMAKGLGGKFSSSSGQLMTLSQALEVYEPQVLRWLFVSRKPNLDFSIAFDLDVMKAYDDFDRTERFAFGLEEGDEKKLTYERRIYELSIPLNKDIPESAPNQIPFRHLCNLLQIHEGNLEKTKEKFADKIKTPLEETRFKVRAHCAWRWIQNYAPEAFRFQVRAEENPPQKTKYPEAVSQLVELLSTKSFSDEESLASAIYPIIKGNKIQPKAFFQEIYSVLIDKTSGPKLASFLLAIGPKRATELLSKSL